MSKINRTTIDDFNADRTLTNLKTVLSEFNIEDYPICEDCNEPILYRNTKFRISRYDVVRHEGSQKLVKTINSVNYHIKICEACLRPQLSERTLRKTRWFNAYNDAVRIACRISQEELDRANSTKAITLENMQRKYGQEDGQLRYDEYRRKQAESNTFEYKRDKYGWTKEQFDEFNKSRGSSLENFIKWHGEEAGKEKWEAYRKMQAETSTNEYIMSTQSQERIDYIKIARVRSFEWCLLKCKNDVKKAREMFINIKSLDKNYSESSCVFFDLVIAEVKRQTNIKFKKPLMRRKELALFCEETNKKRFYDFCMPEINLIIEYHGDMWHANPEKYSAEDFTNTYFRRLNKTAADVWAIDEAKANLAIKHGYDFHVVWESKREEVFDDIVDLIVKKLNIKNTNTKNLQK